MKLESAIIEFPSGLGATKEFDLSKIYYYESRKCDLATVTKQKAPELMKTMEEGYSSCAKILPLIAYELSVAEGESNKRKSEVFLDEAPRILKEKGLINNRNLAGSADLREAVLLCDSQYNIIQDRVEQIKAVYEFIKGKMKGFEMVFGGIKKAYDSSSSYNDLSNSLSVHCGINDEETSPDDNMTGKIGGF